LHSNHSGLCGVSMWASNSYKRLRYSKKINPPPLFFYFFLHNISKYWKNPVAAKIFRTKNVMWIVNQICESILRLRISQIAKALKGGITPLFFVVWSVVGWFCKLFESPLLRLNSSPFRHPHPLFCFLLLSLFLFPLVLFSSFFFFFFVLLPCLFI
jgi:hypothetical protein